MTALDDVSVILEGLVASNTLHLWNNVIHKVLAIFIFRQKNMFSSPMSDHIPQKMFCEHW